MSSSKYLGRAFIRVNGRTIASMPGSAKLNPGGVERSPVMGDFGFLGYTEKPVHAEIECDIAISSDSDLKALQDMVDGTVTFEGDTGQVWIIRKAANAAPISVAAGDGKASVKFIGSPAEQI